MISHLDKNAETPKNSQKLEGCLFRLFLFLTHARTKNSENLVIIESKIEKDERDFYLPD